MAYEVRFGIVGCGRVLSKHTDALSGTIDGASVVAVCDIDGAKAATVGSRLNVPYYTDMHEMAQRHPEIDVFSVLTPSGLHAQHVEELSQHKKHFVVEKPMALTLEDADRMISLCAENNVRLFVVKQNRFNLPVQLARQALEQGRFGKMVMGTVRVRWSRDQAYYDQDAWRGTWALDGGVIANQASHHVDLLTWMMGDVDSVFAYTTTRLVDIEADDTAVAVLKFSSGALGVVEATTATRPVDLEGSLSILGAGGSVEIAGFAVNQMKVWKFTEPRPDDQKMLLHAGEQPPNVYGFGHARFLSAVVQALRGAKAEIGIVDGVEGMRSLILINAMYESMESGREVRLKFRAEHSRLGRTAPMAMRS